MLSLILNSCLEPVQDTDVTFSSLQAGEFASSQQVEGSCS